MPRSKYSAEHSGGKPKDRSISKTVNDQSSQQTISELFATSKHRIAGKEADDLADSTPSKRWKREHSSQGSEIAVPSLRTFQREEMYSSFPSTNARKPEIIELSDDDSPPKPSPIRNKPNGLVRPKNITPQAGLKKLVVKNLRKTPRANPDQYYSHVWDQLDAALSSIFANEEVSQSMEELYRGVEVLCRQGRAPSLYRKLCDKCKHASIGMIEPIMASAGIRDQHVDVLRTVIETWSTWTAQLVSCDIFLSTHVLISLGYRAIDILLSGPVVSPAFIFTTLN